MSNDQAEILILGGPPGAGKSTIAQEMIKLAESPMVYIEGDTFWRFFVAGEKAKPAQKDLSKGAHIIIKAMTLAAIPYAKARLNVIVDFSIAPWHLGFIPDAVKRIPMSYVIVCPSKAVCMERAAGREVGTVSDYSIFGDLHEAFCEIGDFERYAIRDDTISAAEQAQRVWDGWEKGRWRL